MPIYAILTNPLVITICTGLTVIFVAWLFKKSFPRLNDGQGTTQEQNNTQSTVVTNNIYSGTTSTNSLSKSSDEDLSTLKQKTRILFIEDGSFKQINNLRRAGWQVTQVKDVTDFDSSEIRASQIIFVDYKDVGKTLSKEEGLGIVKALKVRYASSKWIVLYSAHPHSLGVHDSADSYLEKNSPLIEIEQKVIEGVRKVVK